MLRVVVLDFETASPVDLKASGAWVYAENPGTEILSLSWAVDDGPVVTWDPRAGDPPPELFDLANDPDVIFVAHNAGFEKVIWRFIMVAVYGLPDVPNGRWHDTMASAASHGLPLGLDVLGRVLRLSNQKWKEGSAVTKALSKPMRGKGKKGMMDRSPEKLAVVFKYNREDIYEERELHKRVGWQSPAERRVWLMDQRINERGVRIDTDYIAAAQRVVDGAAAPRLAEFSDLTGGLAVTQRDKVLKWVRDNGVPLPNLKKETIALLLGGELEAEEDDDEEGDDLGEDDAERIRSIELPDNVRRALEIREVLASASIKKLRSMAASVASDGRVHGALQYYGAVSTGRWAGRLFQPQNFPRGTLKQAPDDIVAAINTGDWRYVQEVLGDPITAVGSGLRHAIVPTLGNQLVVGDYASIEARVVLALAGQHDKTAIMAEGKDIYIDMAKTIWPHIPNLNKTDHPEKRQTGKNAVLGCGFQMGWRKFKMRYAKDMSDEDAQAVIKAYRAEFAPKVPKLWEGLEDAAFDAVYEGGAHTAFGVTYQLEGPYLTALLPSGRKLHYYDPRKSRKAMPWDETDVRQTWTYKALKTGRWVTVDAYGGLLAENVVQALARDLLVDSIFKAEQNGMPLALTVHDEDVCDVPEARADAEALKQIMEDIPDWARALQIPVASETWVGDRYRK